MENCPVCGAEGPLQGPSCEVCGLPADLFGDFQEARVDGDPAQTPGPTPGADEPQSTPAAGRPDPRDPESSGPGPVDPATEPAARHPGEASSGLDIMARRTQGLTNELLEVGEGLGLDVSGLSSNLELARAQGDAHEAWKVRRELTPIIVGGLLDRYRQLCRGRDQISARSGTAKVDAAFTGFRRALREGDIRRADAHLEDADRELSSLRAAWGRIQAEIAETGQIVRELNALGGVAPSVLRQVAESLRVSGRPEPDPVERQVLQTKSFLWHLLVPRIGHELAQSRALLRANGAPLANADLIRAEILRLGEQLRAHRVADALETSKWLRLELVSATRPRPRPTARRSILDQR